MGLWGDVGRGGSGALSVSDSDAECAGGAAFFILGIGRTFAPNALPPAASKSAAAAAEAEVQASRFLGAAADPRAAACFVVILRGQTSASSSIVGRFGSGIGAGATS